jgi:ribosome-associated protein
MYDDPMPAHEDEVEIEAVGIEVDSQPIELYKVLKIANVVSGGGEAKYAIAEGYVAVNGEIELRKRRKLLDGDLIEFNGEYYLIICDQPIDVAPKKKIDPPKPIKKPTSNAKNKPLKTKQENNKAAITAKNKTNVNSSSEPNKTKNKKNQATIEAGIEGGRGRIRFGE